MISSSAESGLLSCLRVDQSIDKKRLAAFTAEDWDKFCALARQHRISPLLDYRLREKGAEKLLPFELREEFSAEFRRQTDINLALMRELCNIVEALDKANIPVIVLKGMHLAPLIYPHIGLRQMHDLDLLVPPDKARKAGDILESLNYRSSQAFRETDFEFSISQHLPAMIKDNFIVELHGRICKPDKIYSIDTHALWYNSQRVEIGGIPVRILDPVDLFLHLCIHISYMHIFIRGIRHYYDLVAILHYYGSAFDWQMLIRRTRERGWERGVMIVLRVNQRLFGLSPPDSVLAELQCREDSAIIGRITEAAFAELWITHSDESQNFSPGFADLSVQKGWWNKACLLKRRVFLPRELLARNYGERNDNGKIFFQYFVRIKDLVVRYRRNLLKLILSDGSLKSAAVRKSSLYRWLEKAN